MLEEIPKHMTCSMFWTVQDPKIPYLYTKNDEGVQCLKKNTTDGY